MTRAGLLALADRVEREEPNDDLNEEIRLVVRHARVIDTNGDYNPKPYTTSLDAAASLVGDKPYVLRRMDTGRTLATIPGGKDVVLGSSWKHPAAALTAAAIRAHAQEMTDE